MTSLGEDCYVGTLHYQALDPPVSGAGQTLQQVCNTGNSTTTPIIMSSTNGLEYTDNIRIDRGLIDKGIGIGYVVNANAVRSVNVGTNVGLQAGRDCVNIGTNCANQTTAQADGCVAIGDDTGVIGQQLHAVAIGYNAGHDTQGASAVAIGENAGQLTQEPNAIAIGSLAGNDTQGEGSIAIGNSAGQRNQDPASIAIGLSAGSRAQATEAVAIGGVAGNDRQERGSIAIGQEAGQTQQGTNAIAIGYSAGNLRQGANSIVIGSAGTSNFPIGSICINAGGIVLNPITASACFINPIRGATNPAGGVANSLWYDTTTKEVLYHIP